VRKGESSIETIDSICRERYHNLVRGLDISSFEAVDLERGERVMTKYLIASRHEPADCLRALDEELAKGTGILDKFVYGCKEGDHTGYAIVDVKNLSDALAMVPGFLQESACITKVDKYTPAEIKAFHAKAA
jgi:hypothetical protein